MSYTTVIGGKLKLKGVNTGSTGLNRNTNNHPTTSSSSSVSKKPSSSSIGLAPPRLPISQPYAPGEREEMSKGYLKNAFARESSSTADVEPSSEQMETEKGNANKQGGGGGGGERKGSTADSSSSPSSSSSSSKQLAVSRKRGRSEDNTVEGERGQGASTSMMTTTNGHVKSGLPGSSDGGRDNYDALQPESRGLLPRARTDGVEVSIATSSLTSSNQHQQQLNTSGGSVLSDQQKISSSSVVTTSSSSSTKTAAQLRFEEAQAKRLHERAKKEAVKSHREKIEDLNKLLETMPEHYDLFRISYGGQG
jgi:hypothetical protein